MDPQTIHKLLNDGLAHHRVGRLADAEAAYRRVLTAQPDNADGLHLLGVIAAQVGNPAGALPLLARAVQILPGMPEFHFHLAQALQAVGRQDEALREFAEAVHLKPDNALFRSEAGAHLLAMGRPADAVEQLRIAAELAPAAGAIIGNYGLGLSRLGRFAEAVAQLERATQLAPDLSPVWSQLAEVHWRRRDYEAALPAARRAVELAPQNPQPLVILGNTLQTLAEFEEAADVYRRALALDPANFDAESNLALTLLKMGRATESLRLYNEIQQRWPDRSVPRANRSLAMLTLGDLAGGFAEYEQRWQSEYFLGTQQSKQPRWDGAPLGGRTILLTTEQGLGDVIQFIRYAPLIAARGGRMIISAAPELHPVLRTLAGVTEMVTPEQLPPHEVFLPVASLPAVFKTTLETIPADVPYLSAEPERIDAWRQRLGGDENLKVGIVWAGTPMHLNDRARSTKLADFAPLAAVDGVTFYSLQKGPPAAQAANPPAGMKLVPLGEELRDFGDSAALLSCLDLLISVDTSVVHLAGALARPVWTLLAKGPDWRWMLDREDSPWYPTMWLFRQQQLGQWPAVFERVAGELRRLVAQQKETR